LVFLGTLLLDHTLRKRSKRANAGDILMREHILTRGYILTEVSEPTQKPASSSLPHARGRSTTVAEAVR
jgi:hypothetical protein